MASALTLPPSQRLRHLWPVADREEYLRIHPVVSHAADNALPWNLRIPQRFPSFCRYPMGARHAAFWEWRDSIGKERPQPFVALWSRGSAKSTSAEMFVCDAGESMLRPYAVYVSETQDQADKHVAAIATMFERRGIGRGVNKYGNSKGWRRNRLSTANGFTVDALGFDTAARGIKLDENRPGIFVFDDVDGKHDTERTTQKKIETLTETLLPAMSEDCVVLFVQNLIHRYSIATRLSNKVPDMRADFLVDRIVSGPFKAVEDMEVAVVYDELIGANRTVISGRATWEGQSLEACQNAVDTYGLSAFLRESQHEVFDTAGQMFDRDWFEIIEPEDLPVTGDRVRRYDDAATENGGDWSACLLMARVGETYFVEDVQRFQYGSAKRDARFRAIAEADFAKYGMNVRQVGVQDPGSAGVDRKNAFFKMMQGMASATERETGDKRLRADGVARAAGQRNIKLVRAPWNEAFLRELERFTGQSAGETDDQVDVFSGSYNRLSKRRDIGGAIV